MSCSPQVGTVVLSATAGISGRTPEGRHTGLQRGEASGKSEVHTAAQPAQQQACTPERRLCCPLLSKPEPLLLPEACPAALSNTVIQCLTRHRFNVCCCFAGVIVTQTQSKTQALRWAHQPGAGAQHVDMVARSRARLAAAHWSPSTFSQVLLACPGDHLQANRYTCSSAFD